jgi:hypothetical protein
VCSAWGTKCWEYGLGFSGQHEHGPKTGAQSTAQHEIIWVGLARLEGRLELGLKFQPVGPQHDPHRWAGLGPARHNYTQFI